MPDIGSPELLIVLVIVLLIFGGGKLPEAGRSMGQAIREFRKAPQGESEKGVRAREPHSGRKA